METMMSTIWSALSTADKTGQSWSDGLATIFKRWWDAYATSRLEQAAIAKLLSMSDRELKDIGLTRSEIFAAVSGGMSSDRTRGRYR